MSNTEYKPQYKRDLPHYQPPGMTLFVTTRLAGTLPRHVSAALRADAVKKRALLQQESEDDPRYTDLLYEQSKREFGAYDATLDKSRFGPTWLCHPEIAAMVCKSIEYRDGRVYRLDAYVVMPNHIHIVFAPLKKDDDDYYSLASIMMSLKRWTAGKANDILGRDGQFWQHESYDHVIREGEWSRIITYVLNNPAKAGLVESYEAWPWWFLREEW